MQQISCGIIQDLLISYCDELAAENVAEMIQEHLAECPECRRVREQILQIRKQEEQQELSRGRSFKRKLVSLRHYMLGGIIGIILPFAALVLWYLLASVRSYIEIMFMSYFL